MESTRRYYQVTPGRKRLKTTLVRVIFLGLGHAFQTAWKLDPAVKKEVESWPDTFSIYMQVEPDGPSLAIVKRNGVLQFLGEKEMYNADLVIVIKNIEFIFRMAIGMLSMPRITCENRQYIKGDLGMLSSFLRCMNRALVIFAPGITGLYIKKVPKMSLLTIRNIVAYYTVGILGMIK